MSIDHALELQELAWALQQEGKLEEAFLACREALRLTEESEGPDSLDAVNLLNDLAEIEIQSQHFEAALILAEQARHIEDALGDGFNGEMPARIRSKTFGLLGEIWRTQGDYDRAEPALHRALGIAVDEFGEASEEAAQARNNLAVLYKYTGCFAEARHLYQDALRSIIAICGENSLAAGTIFHNIGGVLHAQGDFAAAEEPGRKAWHISRTVLGEDDPQTMLDAAAYAAILDGLERYPESEPIYLRAIAVFERIYGPEHYEVAANLHNLGAVLAAVGRYRESEERYRRALDIKEKLLAVGSPDIALTRNNLGSLLSQAGRPAEAVPLLQQALADLERRLESGHPHVALVRKNLREALSSAGSVS